MYINDSFEAADALSKARAFAEQGRWREAAEMLQGASERLTGHIVRTPQGLVSLRAYVAQAICAWPAEGLRAYQDLYETKLQKEITRLGNSRELQSAIDLFDLYFCTTGAAAMAEQIAQAGIEAGDLSLAQWALKRVLDKHPAGKSHATRYQALLTLVAAMLGEPLGDLADRGQTRLRWKGRDTSLAEAVAQISTEFHIDSRPAAEDWPMFGGNMQRSRAVQTRVDQPGLLWRFPLKSPGAAGRTEGIMDGLVRGSVDASRGTTVFPIVAGDFVYVQMYRAIVALRRNSGALAWSLAPDDSESVAASVMDDRFLGGDTPVFEEGRVYAALPTQDNTYYDYETARTVHELVALDGTSGAVIWRAAQKSVDSQGTATAYDSAPIVRNGRLFIISRRRRSFGFEDCYLDAHRAADGKLLFRTHLASASTSALSVRGATRSIAAIDDGTVYVCTNLGTIAAVSAYTGGVQWMHLYDRLRPDASGTPPWPARDSGSVPLNPLVYSGGKVAALPADAPRLLILAATDGRPIHDIAVPSLLNMYTFLGLRDNLICGLGDEVLCFDLEAQRITWSHKLADESQVAGRGMWAEDELFIPSRDALRKISVQDGSATTFSMGSQYQPGNVLILPEQILVAGAEELQCYVRKAEIWKTIKERIAAAPNDPVPALEFAELAIGAGELNDAIQAIKEAVGRIKPSLTTAPAPLRERVLADTLKLAESVTALAGAEEDLFRIAGEAAGEPASQVEYRFRFAAVFERLGKPQRAIRLYQQILRDRTLREWGPPRTDAGTVRAQAKAFAAIEQLMRRHGPEVYAEFETEAQQRLDEARSTGDELALRRIMETFPNSLASAKALMEYAILLGRQGRHEASAHAWERAYRQDNNPATRAAKLQSIAQSYERAGKPEMAYLWLRKAAREFPAISVEVEGRNISFAAYRDRLSKARVLVEPSRPTIKLPLQKTFEHDLVGPVSLMHPAQGEDPAENWDHVFVQNPDGIRGYSARDGNNLWTQPAPVRMNAQLLTARSDYAVFATPFEVFAIDASTGSRKFSHGEYPARLGDPGADWEDGTSFRVHSLHAGRLVSVREDGRATCLDIGSGEVIWTATRRPAPLGPVRLSESELVYHVARDGHAVIQVASAATGELLESVVTDEQRPVEALHVTLDGRIVMVTSKSMASYDAARQERNWQLSLSWPIRKSTLVFDMDSAYFLDEAGAIRKIGLEDGRMVWESDRVLGRSEQNETLKREGDYLFLCTSDSVRAVDAANGLLLWEGTTPENARFVQWSLSGAYLAGLHIPDDAAKAPARIYFYDHRNASGVIPRAGGVIEVVMSSDERSMMIANGAVVVQSGTMLQGFTSK